MEHVVITNNKFTYGDPVGCAVKPVTFGPNDTGAWIGDFPPATHTFPNPRWITRVACMARSCNVDCPDFQSYVNHWPVSLVGSTDQWQVTLVDGVLFASTDMPGVRPGDLKVTIEGRFIRAEGKRFDYNHTVVRVREIGDDYDGSAASSTYEAGVLTVKVPRLKQRVSHNVAVVYKGA